MKGFGYLGSQKKLDRLILRDCERISDVCLKIMSEKITSLKILDLGGCKVITDQGINSLRNLTELNRLNLSGCTLISDQGLEHLNSLQNLERLGLYNCKNLTEKGIPHLTALSKLKILDLTIKISSKNSISALKELKFLNQLDLTCSEYITSLN